MIYVVQDYNREKNRRLVDDMFRLRAKVFKQRLSWNVSVQNDLERDKYDNEGPVYIIHTDQSGRVDGSCRLLPTTGPTLLAETFLDTLPDIALLSAPSIWECTRFCVDYDHTERADLDKMIRVSRYMLLKIGTLALKSGIETVLGNFDIQMLRIYRQVGCRVEVLGSTKRFGKPVYLGAFPISAKIVEEGRQHALKFKQRALKKAAVAADVDALTKMDG